MNLKRKPVAGIEEFDEQRKAVAPAISSEQLRAVLLNKLPEGLTGVRTVGENRLRVGAVANFPTFADAFTGGNIFAISSEGVAAPDAFDEDGFEFVWIKHVALAVVECFA